MTSATERPRYRLNKLLKECGIDYWCMQQTTFWNCDDGRECLAYEFESDGIPNLAMKVVGLTPEQAIAATLGIWTRLDKIGQNLSKDTALGGGRLTAEQVRKAVDRHGNIMDNRLYCDWQATADELNAALEAGECEDVSTELEYFECSECGCKVDETGVEFGTVNFCPDCGKAVGR